MRGGPVWPDRPEPVLRTKWPDGPASSDKWKVLLVSARALNNQARYNDVDFTRLKANVSCEA